jgi:hypothetical protein
VSIWLGVKKPNQKAMKGVDILKDLCGVESYDLDFQELAAVSDDFPKATVEEILRRLSYSSSFIEATMKAAAKRKITDAYWALAQYDYAYKTRAGVAKDPVFIGAFDWNDAEDELPHVEAAGPKPDFSGVWDLDREASKLSGGAVGMVSGEMRIEHVDPRFACSAKFIGVDGKAVEFTFERLSVDSITDPGGKDSSCYWDGNDLVTEDRIPTGVMTWRYEMVDPNHLRAQEALPGRPRPLINVWEFRRR